jgi:hypothetical protein
MISIRFFSAPGSIGWAAAAGEGSGAGAIVGTVIS